MYQRGVPVRRHPGARPPARRWPREGPRGDVPRRHQGVTRPPRPGSGRTHRASLATQSSSPSAMPHEGRSTGTLDPLNTATNRCIEHAGWASPPEHRRSGGGAGSARPGKDDRIEDEFGRDVRREKFGGARSTPIEEPPPRHCLAGPRLRPRRRAPRAVPCRGRIRAPSARTRATSRATSSHSPPQQAFDRPPALGRRHGARGPRSSSTAIVASSASAPAGVAPVSGSSWPAGEGRGRRRGSRTRPSPLSRPPRAARRCRVIGRFERSRERHRPRHGGARGGQGGPRAGHR